MRHSTAKQLGNLTRLCYSPKKEKGKTYEYGYHTSSGENKMLMTDPNLRESIARNLLKSYQKDIERLEAVNPDWRESFDPKFVAAIIRAVSDYSIVADYHAETVSEARQQADVTAYIAMSMYTSIERVIKKKRLDD